MYDGGVIDCDVHHDWPSPDALLPYLSSGWREYVVAPTRAGLPCIPLTPTQMCPNPNGATQRPDSFPANGVAAASDYELMREQLLDPSRIERAVLDYGHGMFVAANPNPYFAVELCRAANDWTIDTWLDGKDDRLYGAILLPTQTPDEAAKEIRRVGGHPHMVEALMLQASAGKAFGHPVYHPIYEAAVEMNVPIAVHVGGESAPLHGLSPMASGLPNFYFEVHTQVAQGMMTHVMSLIAHGVFEEFPTLRVLMVESTLAWVPWLLWSMDTGYKGLRRETPWLKRHPSEYFHDHFRMTTQPLDDSPEPEQAIEIFKMFGGEDILCFSSDYPHWDGDEVDHVAKRLPASWLPKVFRENAMELFQWSDPPGADTDGRRAEMGSGS